MSALRFRKLCINEWLIAPVWNCLSIRARLLTSCASVMYQ